MTPSLWIGPGHVQWVLRQKDQGSDISRSYILPEVEAHGGGQDTRQG